MNAKRIISLVLLVFLLAVAGWVGFHLTHPVSIGTIELTVAQGPADDTALKQWLSSQPGVLKTSVERGSNSVTVKYKLNNAKAMDYADTVVAQCKQLGYDINRQHISSNANPFLGTPFFPDTF